MATGFQVGGARANGLRTFTVDLLHPAVGHTIPTPMDHALAQMGHRFWWLPWRGCGTWVTHLLHPHGSTPPDSSVPPGLSGRWWESIRRWTDKFHGHWMTRLSRSQLRLASPSRGSPPSDHIWEGRRGESTDTADCSGAVPLTQDMPRIGLATRGRPKIPCQ